MKTEKKEWYYDRNHDEIFVPTRYNPRYGDVLHERKSIVRLGKGTIVSSAQWLSPDQCYKLRQPNEITFPLMVAEMNKQMSNWSIDLDGGVNTIPAINAYCFKRKKKRDDKYAAERLQKHKQLV